MKKMTLPVAVFVAILGCVLAVSANVTTMQMHDHLQKERARRIQAENKMQQMQGELQKIKQKLIQSTRDLAGIQDILNKHDTEKNVMREKLEQLNKQNQTLMQQMENLKGPQGPTAPKPEESQGQ